MRDLLTNPAWQAEDLGLPLPDKTHACSVCLPTWESVIDYEEGRDRVLHHLRAGYPRFVMHPAVDRLVAEARRQIAETGEDVTIFPTKEAAQRALRFVEKQGNGAARITNFEGLQALVTTQTATKDARLYWRFAGEIVSSRQAGDAAGKGVRALSPGIAYQLRMDLAKFIGTDREHVFVYESGMAAIFAAHRAVCVSSKKKTLQLEFPYVDAMRVQQHFGNGVVFLNQAEGEDFEQAIGRIRRGEFSAVFTEVPSNPLLRTIDLIRVSEACRDGGVLLVVDNTIASSENVDVLPYADIVTTSLTKWISGKGDVCAGQVTVREDSHFAADLLEFFRADCPDGSRLYLADAEILQKNFKKYPQRMAKINQTAAALVEWLDEQKEIAQIWYPNRCCHKYFDAIRKEGGGYGGLFSIVLTNPKKAPKFFDQLRISKGPSLGTDFSLACPYTMLAHYDELDWAEGCGVSQNLIRFSIGLEPLDTLKKVFEDAFEGL